MMEKTMWIMESIDQIDFALAQALEFFLLKESYETTADCEIIFL